VMFFPKGLAGLWESHGHLLTRFFRNSGSAAPKAGGAGPVPAPVVSQSVPASHRATPVANPVSIKPAVVAEGSK
jgi:hypothetical protein